MVNSEHESLGWRLLAKVIIGDQLLPQTGLRRYVEAGRNVPAIQARSMHAERRMSPVWAALTHSITGRGATNLTKRILF